MNESGAGAGAAEARTTTLGAAVANAGERVQDILDTAERVAAQIQADAEAAAARHLEKRRLEADQIVERRIDDLAELTRGLKGRLEAVQQVSLALLAELETATARMVRVPTGDRDSALGTMHSVPHDRSAPLEPIAYPGTARRDHTRQQGVLRATQMAVAGTDRSEIEQMLRTEFDIEDADSVVDKLYGSQSD